MSLLLVRHGHAGSRTDWIGPDRDRPLSAKGIKQADHLSALADSYTPKRLLSSPFQRCVQTLEPLSRVLGVPVETTDALAEGHAMSALRLVRELVGDSAALCTHGDVIPEILMALADEDSLALDSPPRQAKGSVWVLEPTDHRFARASYIAPTT